MAEETRSFEDLKAEQDRLWAENDAQPVPPGYNEWLREQVEIALREADDPSAVTYTMEEVEAETRAQIQRWRARERKSA